ncbi:hypothetical protein DNFV4_00450 [Nitrospira tepida]|uniref:Uncharacterized protein n=1 Tax=Nitrospira tepida TaxID=2973512 RepID=A0AA86MVZ2_9BACT|nr:hypothetical protein DNFV4_00450 [Nitrospira tepida]
MAEDKAISAFRLYEALDKFFRCGFAGNAEPS